MIRRLLLLNGIAIFCVATHHASGYGFQAMFQWTDRYLPVSVPDYSQIGSLAFYAIITIQQIDWFALSGMMFVSGFFITIAAGLKNPKLGLKLVLGRVRHLIIPFLVWSAIFFILFVRRLPQNLDEVLDRYYYIPLLCVYYLISPLIVRWAIRSWKPLLGLGAFLELGRFGLRYFADLGLTFPGQAFLIQITPRWLPPTLIFWFILGIIVGFHQKEFTRWLARVKWYALGAMIVLGVATFIEYQLFARQVGEAWLGPYFGGFSRYLYSGAVIISFLAFDQVSIPFSKQLADLGSKSLGIYLAHSRWMYVAAVVMYRALPWMLGQQILYQTTLIIVGLGGSVLLMWIMKRSPAKRYYRYVFG